MSYGLIPEFVGRFPLLVTLDALTESELVTVMTEPRNALGRQYSALIAMNNTRLHITSKAYRAVARQVRLTELAMPCFLDVSTRSKQWSAGQGKGVNDLRTSACNTLPIQKCKVCFVCSSVLTERIDVSTTHRPSNGKQGHEACAPSWRMFSWM